MTAATAVTESPAPVSHARANVVFATVVLGMLMAALDQTIVSTALPTIVADLGGAGHMAWVVTSYLLAEAVATALAGKFGDMFGRKLVFQLSGLIFIIGSMVAGLAHGMTLLVVARAIQGVGAGGLMVTAMALIADVIPLRERGKYQGALGAVFGVTTVIGPTLGGLFTDHASWRWCFYVNVPIAILMIAVAARAIPSVRAAARPVIDYAGIALVAVGVSCLILALEWGGQEYPWGSATIIGLFVAAVILLTAFVFAELRAKEPMLPMHLFRSNVFTVCSILSFIVGFAMLGAMTYLPAYLQYVNGVSATASGLRTLPLVVGLFTTSIISGQVVGRTGQYKYFPVAGTAVMALGLFLMSTMGRETGFWLESLYMLILGLGIGLAMQVLTIVVQNTVPYSDLGTATSGVTFFRTVGSTFGTAIFGTLYSSRIGTELSAALAGDPGVPPAAAGNPQLLKQLPEQQRIPIIDAYAHTIEYVFRWVVPVALLGFAVAWFLKQVPLRDSARAEATDVGAGFSMPDSVDRVVLLEHSLASVMRRLRDDELPDPRILAAADSTLTRDQAWAIGQVEMLNRVRGTATLDAIARAHWMPPEVLEPVYDTAVRNGYVEFDGTLLNLTDSGQAEYDRIFAAWRQWLCGHLDDWDCAEPEDRELLDRALDNIAAKLLDEADRPDALPAAAR
ncbi:EmrB/QacA subfamily drug resistance transporter [Nocardia transvalensis]|uniref:EmrB/QacA subfamily drug resistance transporter n=1 Tax=Nocardia transvalensis TaxID=37333 RepID=A0A7W9PFI6_9NOCA|nr:MDR family MFS transporter [Nocardia transvalensis]MBB5914980.1 EmrB/QacA subfamily drug resistance transporter [Nocardia transvalensis]